MRILKQREAKDLSKVTQRVRAEPDAESGSESMLAALIPAAFLLGQPDSCHFDK